LTNKWQGCKTKYNNLRQNLGKNTCIGFYSSRKQLDQYNRDRSSVDSDLAAIRVAVETRAQTALLAILGQRDRLTTRIDEHLRKEQEMNG
jgi:hypothetical protein